MSGVMVSRARPVHKDHDQHGLHGSWGFSVEIVVCMGDTLSHLSTGQSLQIIPVGGSALKPGGRLWPHYGPPRTSQEPHYSARTLYPIRSDRTPGDDLLSGIQNGRTVVVHDLINLRDDNGMDTPQKEATRNFGSCQWVTATPTPGYRI